MADHQVPLTFEAEIRDTQEHHSDDDPSNDADYTVVTDELHTNLLRKYDRVRVYVDDDHDASYDVEILHTWKDDTDFSGEITATTLSMSSGQDSATATIDGPIHHVRFRFATGALASAPTQGSVSIMVDGIE